MNVSMNIYAVKPADDDYKRKSAAWRACDSAGIPVPKELDEFFNGEEPDPTGTVIDIADETGESLHASCKQLDAEDSWTFEVDITKLPKGTRYVRVRVGEG